MIVLDTSALVKLVTKEPGAEAVLARIVAEGDRIAPDWIKLETANALAKKVRFDGLPREVAIEALAAAPAYLTETIRSEDLLDRAFGLALSLQHAIYDCLYLALAIERRCVVVSSDRKFFLSAERGGWRGNVELLT